MGFDSRTYLLDLKTGRERRVFEGVRVGQAAAFSRDGRYIAFGTQEGEVLVYRMDDLENEVARLDTGLVTTLAFSDDSKYVAMVSDFYTAYPAVKQSFKLRLWPLQPEELIKEATERLSLLPHPAH